MFALHYGPLFSLTNDDGCERTFWCRACKTPFIRDDKREPYQCPVCGEKNDTPLKRRDFSNRDVAAKFT